MSDLVSAIASNFADKPKLERKAVYRSNTKAFIITMLNNHNSLVAARKCLQSIKNTKSFIDPYLIDATTPIELNQHLKNFNLSLNDYSYPKSPAETQKHVKTGLELSGYRASDYTKVVSCLVSHMRLWKLCKELNETIIILEHDALFTTHFNIKKIQEKFTGGVMGLNDPIGATRKAGLYDNLVKANYSVGNFQVPTIDKPHIPQGLAGNSAYIIKPEAATHLLDKVYEIGMWPNDALMCQQFFPWLQQVYPYFTTIQGTKSSTTL